MTERANRKSDLWLGVTRYLERPSDRLKRGGLELGASLGVRNCRVILHRNGRQSGSYLGFACR